MTTPDARQLRAFVEGLRARVRDHHVIITAPAADRLCLVSYTIGMTEHRLPEMILFGLSQQIAGTILNRLAARAIKSREIALETPITKIANMPLMAIAAETSRVLESAPMIANVYGADDDHPWRAVQVLLPDAAGRWPFDAGSDPTHALTQRPWLGSPPILQ